MGSQVGKGLYIFVSVHRCGHAHTRSPTFLLPSLSSAKRQWKGIWGAFAACGLWALSLGEKGGDGGQGGLCPWTGTPVLSQRDACGLNKRTVSFCPFVLFRCLWGRAGHAFGFERKELTFTLNFTCKLLTSKQTRGSQGGEVGKGPSPTFLTQRGAALATRVRSLALGITGTRLTVCVCGGAFQDKGVSSAK